MRTDGMCNWVRQRQKQKEIKAEIERERMKKGRTETKRGGDIIGRQEHTGDRGRGKRQQIDSKKGDTESQPHTRAHVHRAQKKNH